MKLMLRAAALSLVFACLAFAAAPALADAAVVAATTAVPPNTSTTVSIPFGDWINAIAPTIIEIAGAVLAVILAWAARLLPASLQSFINSQTIAQAEQLLEKAVDYGINAVAGASVGKTLSVDVGNQVIAQALNYVITHGPAWLINWLGGVEAIKQKIIARLPLDEGAQVITTAASVAIAPSPLAGSGSPSPLGSSPSASVSG